MVFINQVTTGGAPNSSLLHPFLRLVSVVIILGQVPRIHGLYPPYPPGLLQPILDGKSPLFGGKWVLLLIYWVPALRRIDPQKEAYQ